MAVIRSYKSILIGLTILCAILLAASAYLFFHDAAALRRAGLLTGPRNWHRAGSMDTTPVPAGIRIWMTFDFVNDIFHLPPAYLKGALSIQSSTYPRITVAQAAKAAGVSETTFLLQVQNAVASYSAPQP